MRDDEASDWRPLLVGAAGRCGDDGHRSASPKTARACTCRPPSKLEHRSPGEDGHHHGHCRRDRRGPGVRHRGRDVEPGHARGRGRDGVPAIAWSTRSSTTRSAAISKRYNGLAPGDLGISDRKRRRHDVARRLRRRQRAGAVLYLGPRRESGDVPVRPPAAAQRLPAGADGAVQLHGARRADDPRLSDLPRRRRACRPACGTRRCTAGRGSATVGGWIPRRSGWPTGLRVRARELPRIKRLW